MRGRPIPKWCVVDAIRQVMVCERCGGAEALRWPIRVDAFVLRAQAFALEHEWCKPAKGGAP